MAQQHYLEPLQVTLLQLDCNKESAILTWVIGQDWFKKTGNNFVVTLNSNDRPNMRVKLSTSIQKCINFNLYMVKRSFILVFDVNFTCKDEKNFQKGKSQL